MMKQLITARLVCVIGLFFLVCSPVSAEENYFAVGAVGGASSTVYKGVDDDLSLLPMIALRQDQFFVEGTAVGVSLITREKFQLDVYGEYRGRGYEASDSAFLRGMQERKSSIDVGMTTSAITDFGLFSLDASFDASSTHEGYEFFLLYSIPLVESEKLSLTPSCGLSWQSQKTVDYYYGVRNSEVRSGRAAYSPDSSLSAVASLDIEYRLSQKWGLVGQLQGTFWGEEVRDSPLVDKDFSGLAAIGLTYRLW